MTNLPLKPFVLFLLVAGIASPLVHAQRQRTDTGYYRTAPIPAHLMPVERAAGSSVLRSVYFYGGKKLSSPYSLEVPFYELNDPTINHHFQTFRTTTTLSGLVGLATLGYTLIPRNRNRGTNWTVLGGSIVASLTFNIIGNGQVNKAVSRYNQMLRQPRVSVGMSAAPVPLTGQTAVGAGMAWQF